MKTNTSRPSRGQGTVLRQICELIPAHLVAKSGRELGVEKQARSFGLWSHVVAMLHAQVSHALSLNDVCDALHNWRTPLRALRGATPPSRNALSHANKVRTSDLAQRVFWGTLEHLQAQWPGFGRSTQPRYAWRFRRSVHVVDATVIRLVASCLDWAKHRRRKAAAKCHLRLSLRSLLPSFALVDVASEHDNTRAREVCAGLQDGEIVVFDKAYLDLFHLRDLNQRGVCFVTRAKETLDYRVIRRRRRTARQILSDEVVQLTGPLSQLKYPTPLRLVRMRLELDGEERELSFLTNNLEWQPTSIGDLYRSRWQIEAFFKQIKQTLQLADFLGHNANAVQWQVWMALLVYVLLRFIAWQNHWAHSFSRLLTMLRSALWMPRHLRDLLHRCGTAHGAFRCMDPSAQSELPGLHPSPVGQPI